MTLRAALRHQAKITESMGSPFTALVLRCLADRLEPGGQIADRLLSWEGDLGAAAQSIPLRIAGALHGLVLDGTDPALAAVYPPNAATGDTLWAEIARALVEHADRIDDWLKQAPQTNEVGRSAVLIAAGHMLDARLGLPLVLSELGASAGLNLHWDSYALNANDVRLGPDAPTLTLRPEWRGVLPTQANPTIQARRGTDLNPLNPTDPAARLRLLAYIWPDQAERLTRTRAALEAAEALVDQADAADWLETRLALKAPGACRLIYHTVAWQYFPDAVQSRATGLIEAAGARATTEAPLAWLGMEADGQTPGAALALRLWPGNETWRLGRADFHARWVDWAPERIS